MSNVNSKTN